MNPPLVFEYAIKFPSGKYYTGRVNSESRPDYWQGEKHEAYTFTEKGAYYRMNSLFCFEGCAVEKVI